MAAESIKEIHFTIARHDEHAVKLNKLASPVTFKLGLGPCGRYVDSIESTIDYHGVTIKQVSYPEDYGHLRESWTRLNDTNVTNMRLITGYSPYTGRKVEGHGYGNTEAMTPTKEKHEANIKLASELLSKYTVLHDQVEIKEFFYKLEDVRGRIIVIR